VESLAERIFHVPMWIVVTVAILGIAWLVAAILILSRCLTRVISRRL
jgi:hypothetical protein